MTKVIPGRATKLNNYLGKFSKANNKGYSSEYVDADLKNAFDFINNEFGGDYDPYDDYSNFRYATYDDISKFDSKRDKRSYYRQNEEDDDLSYSAEHGEQQFPVFSREDKPRRSRSSAERDREIAGDVRYQEDEGRHFQESSQKDYERRSERMRERDSE